MDKARLDEVKRRNKILQACKEWENNGIKISINDFMTFILLYNYRKNNC